MTYNPNQLAPPEPNPDDVCDCAVCRAVVYRDDAHRFGSHDDPTWVCDETECLAEYCRLLTAEKQRLVNRTQRLLDQVTHGITYSGAVDFGRWDVFGSDLFPDTCLVLKPNQDNGRYRVIQLDND